ncbi:MAG: glycosyl hydrolase family 28-related protein, partial [Kiritimatiellia bacterium]|nr:glycosyl hydrolase family 28-related protein [Kiritimatiellia bacterium]
MRRTAMTVMAAAAATAWALPQVVTPRFPAPDLVIAEETLVPPSAAGTDAAPLLQAAIDRVAQRGGGTVFAAAGTYRIASHVIVREGVTLRGDSAAQTPGAGTLLSITADKGREDAPATFSLERGAGLTGLTFWYPEQRLPDPVPYPWTVKNAAMPANDNQTVADCTFVNAWKAICIGPDGNELHTFRTLRICALKIGIEIDSTTDIGRMSEVTVAPSVWLASGLPGVPPGPVLHDYLLREDTVAVMIGRSDWEYIWRLEVFGYRRGLVFRKGAR